MSTDLHI